mmetsp:Transcript_1915/g.3453  ORF Transcript_1915/g.3453 Transcript_1915/m.3453 type:complete len:455 (-) Transcript_1915:1441-2805(-)
MTGVSRLRYGEPVAFEGELDKDGKKFGGRKTRYFRLRDGALYNHRKRGSPPTWAVSVIDCKVKVEEAKNCVVLNLYDGKSLVLYGKSPGQCTQWASSLKQASTRKIGSFYGVTGIIGMGAFAEVRLGFDKQSGDQVAIKIMKKNKKDKELMKSVECEIHFIRKQIDHPNVVRTFDVFNTKDNLFIVMEYMPGGMLYDILASEGQFSEAHASVVMREIFLGVKCLHDNDIVHRDIKPENVLCKNKEWPYRVKIADFGLADFVLEDTFGDKSTRGMYGTPFFVAPEVIRGEAYGPAVDVWSCGVLLYNMLSGQLPFDGNNIKDVLRRVRSGTFDFPPREWSKISEDVKNLLRGLLKYDPKERMTSKAALEHPWLNSNDLSTAAIENDRKNLTYEYRKQKTSSMAMDDVMQVIDDPHVGNKTGDDESKFGFGKMSVFFSGHSSSDTQTKDIDQDSDE